MPISYDAVRELIDMAIREDLGDNLTDVTSDAVFHDETATAELLCKETIVLCGTDLIRYVYQAIDPVVTVEILFPDGEVLGDHTVFATIHGKVRSLLKGERIVLNFLQRMSGVATQTKTYVNALNSTTVKLLDTRKTIPGYRHLDKYAVKTGGGENHRMGLYDMVMIKDNHKNAAGSVSEAIDRVRNHTQGIKVEVEVETIEEAREAARKGCDIIMLDNMNNEEIIEASRAIRSVNASIKIEVSGGITIERLSSLGQLDIDFISSGALTHSVRAVDISMEMQS